MIVEQTVLPGHTYENSRSSSHKTLVIIIGNELHAQLQTSSSMPSWKDMAHALGLGLIAKESISP
jgi:hypothetical protein